MLTICRKYLYWTQAYKRSEQACAQMKQIAEQVLSMYRSRMSTESQPIGNVERESDMIPTDGSKGSIMRRIIEHDYPSDAHRISEIISFIVAGHETSAFTLCFFLFEMARHPVELRRLQEELDAAIGPESCPNGRPTLAQVSFIKP